MAIPELHRETLSVSDMEQIFARHVARPDFVKDCLAALDVLDENQVCRPIWLLRKFARHQALEPATLGRLADRIQGVDHWLTRLVACQLFAETGCPADSRDTLESYFLDCFRDRRVIVRAWAVSALLRCSDNAIDRPDVRAVLKQARQDSSKAMQARLRKLRQSEKDRRR